jgi:hypothetical protein
VNLATSGIELVRMGRDVAEQVQCVGDITTRRPSPEEPLDF